MTPNMHSIEAEQAVLGSILIDGERWAEVADVVKPDDFYRADHRAIFAAMSQLAGRHVTVDLVTLTDYMDRMGTLSLAGGVAYIGTLGRDTPSSANARTYAEVIRVRALARRMIDTMHRATARLETDMETETVQEVIRQLAETSMDGERWTSGAADVTRRTVEVIDQYARRMVAAVPTGLRQLDGLLGGFHPGDLIVVAARPAMGKTALMLNFAEASDVPVGIASAEQGVPELGMRLVGIRSGVPVAHMRANKLTDGDWAAMDPAFQHLAQRPYHVFDKPGQTIEEIERQAWAWKQKHGIGLLLVDYLQKLKGGVEKDYRLRVGEYTGRLKDVARFLRIPVVLFAQVKREVEARGLGKDGLGRMPWMSDIAESGVVEQDGDQVITLYRPEVYEKRSEWTGLAYLNVCKNRHGPVGHVCVSWSPALMKFGEPEKGADLFAGQPA